MKPRVEIDVVGEGVDRHLRSANESEDLLAQRSKRFESLRVREPFGGHAGCGAFEHSAQFDRIVHVFHGKGLNPESPLGHDFEKALVRQPFESEMKRDSGDVQLGGERNFANFFAGPQLALNQQFPQRERCPRRLGR